MEIQNPNKLTTLSSQDGILFPIDQAVAMQSETITNMIYEDRDASFFLITTPARTLAKIIDYWTLQERLGMPEAILCIRQSQWFAMLDRGYDVDEVMEIATVANDHGCKGLMHIARELVEGMSPMDAAKYFQLRLLGEGSGVV